MKRKVKTELQERVYTYFNNARSRARREGVKFNLTQEYIASIMTSHCPIFGTMFDWTPNFNSQRENNFSSPELDKVFSEDGYIMGNVVFICHEANRIKDKGTMDQHYAIADFMHEIEKQQQENLEYAQQREFASVPTDIYKQRKNDSEHGPLFATGPWQDSDNPDDHSGAISGKDPDHSTQESSGDSMGGRDAEMEALIVAQSVEDRWPREPKTLWIAKRSRHLPD